MRSGLRIPATITGFVWNIRPMMAAYGFVWSINRSTAGGGRSSRAMRPIDVSISWPGIWRWARYGTIGKSETTSCPGGVCVRICVTAQRISGGSGAL